MAKSILDLAISLDGFIAGKHNEIDWLEQYDDLSEYGFDKFLSTIGAILMGNRSYEQGIERGWFKDQTYGPSPIVVVCSQAPKQPSDEADFRFITDGIEAAYRAAQDIAGDKNIYVFGGASTVQQLLTHNLLDEIHLGIVPVLLGQGVRLFDQLEARRILLERLKVSEHARGLTSVSYRVVK